MIDLNQLQQLITFFEEGTITRAAEKLMISQPALTRSLQRLEEELDVKLFIRQKNKTTFTDTGLFVVEEAMKLLTHAEHFTHIAKRHELKHSTLFIGICAPGPMFEIESNFEEKKTGHKIKFSMNSTNELITSLLEETNQIVFTDYLVEDERITSKPMFKEQLNIAVLPTHPLASKEEITFKDLSHLSILLLTDLGVWDNLSSILTDVHFIRQQDSDAFNDLITASALPYFTTNITQQYYGYADGKIEIPISDKEATKTFYINVLNKNKHLINLLL
ncbi:LysR family transcriptional regulator [Gemella cuniculi]|uniref:LysR family transcriptional regulator n=1 Tax=Gemella cuniculi TaxID=150240 RepID=UPI000420858E|nr:LysR family transcriptional regulator [Gemella cuniculi]